MYCLTRYFTKKRTAEALYFSAVCSKSKLGDRSRYVPIITLQYGVKNDARIMV